MSNNLDPKILAKLNKESAFIQSQQRGARQIKIEKGQTIVVRFLPARMGPSGVWYARVANHWLDRRPLTCPRLTDEDWGGNQDTECPICTLADQLNDDHDEVVSKWGWNLKANPQYMTYCVLLEKNGRQMSMDEIMIPYVFNLNKSVFEELHAFYVAGGRKSKDSVLDYHKGNDFSVMRTQTRTRLDKLDSLPIFDEDASFDSHIKKLEALLKEPRIKLPTDQEMEAFLLKAEAASRKIGQGDSDAVRPRRRAADEDEAPRGRRAADDDDDAPRGRRAADPEEEAPRGRRAPDPEGDPESEAPRRRRDDDDDAPRGRRADAEEEAPRRRREDDDEEAPRRRSAATETSTRSAKTRQDDDDDDGDLGPQRKPKNPPPEAEDPDPEPDAGRDADPEGADEGKPEKDPEDDPRPAGRKLTSPANRARAEGGKSQSVEDEDENLPEEERDSAPPAKEPVGGKSEGGEPPPPVSRTGKNAEALRSRLTNLGKNK